MLERIEPSSARGVLHLTPTLGIRTRLLISGAKRICVVRPYHGVNVNADMAGDLGAVYPSSETRVDLTSVLVAAALAAAGKDVVYLDLNCTRGRASLPDAELFLVKCCLPTVKADLAFRDDLERRGIRAIGFGSVMSHVPEGERGLHVEGFAPTALSQMLEVDMERGIESAFAQLSDYDYSDAHGRKLVHVAASIGCNRGCLYCPYIRSLGRWQSVTKSGVAAQIRGAVAAGAERLQFRDQDFASDPEWAVEVASTVGELTVKSVPWAVEGNLDRFTDRVLAACKSNGADEVIFGVESADDSLLKTAHRRPNKDVAARVNAVKDHGLAAHGLFVLGLPGDSYEAARRTVEFAADLGLTAAQFNQYSPLPAESFGTEQPATLADYVPYTNAYRHRTCASLSPTQVRQCVRLAQAAFNAAQAGRPGTYHRCLDRLSSLSGAS